MLPNHSPWIQQLNRTRPVVSLQGDIAADVAIVGAGIAGIATAYFTLRDTDKTVVVLEADKVAHGATGHNAGQLVSYFERSFASLVTEFGLPLAADGQKGVESAWLLLDEIVNEAGLATPLYRFTGYAGYSTLEQVLEHLEDNRLRLQGGLVPEQMLLAREWEEHQSIPERYADLYDLVDHTDLLALLETKDTEYVAALVTPKGCTNSALLSEEIAGYLLTNYPERFFLHEETNVGSIRLTTEGVTLSASAHEVRATHVVLCTNGFEGFTIVNEVGEDINTAFHHDVNGRIGYMVGYQEPLKNAPAAMSYHPTKSLVVGDPVGESYYYFTRRPHEHEGQETYNLVCAGGPDTVLPNLALYSRKHGCSDEMREILDEFLRSAYLHFPEGDLEYIFCWHGLMGYTPNGVRRIGFEPRNASLLYNLGCNGVGILPSLYGGKRIAQLLCGTKLEPSIFDPLR